MLNLRKIYIHKHMILDTVIHSPGSRHLRFIVLGLVNRTEHDTVTPFFTNILNSLHSGMEICKKVQLNNII